jgi:hypothetical protein
LRQKRELEEKEKREQLKREQHMKLKREKDEKESLQIIKHFLVSTWIETAFI